MKTKLIFNKKDAGKNPDFIITTLRNAILKGQYRAGEPLRQDLIAKELSISKGPLREALVQLKAEGLVTFMPKRGAVVSALSKDEVEEIFTMRIALETVAMKRAISRLSAADFIRAKSVLEILDNESDVWQLSELNWEFHEILYKAAQMPILLSTIKGLHNNVIRYLIIYLDLLSAAERSQKEHWELLQACREQDISNAVKILDNHLHRASDHVVSYLS